MLTQNQSGKHTKNKERNFNQKCQLYFDDWCESCQTQLRRNKKKKTNAFTHTGIGEWCAKKLSLQKKSLVIL